MTENANSQSNQPNRKPLIAILVVSILPILLAYTMFFTGMGVPKETKNKGFLIAPVIHLSEMASVDIEQALLNWKDDIKWRLILPLDAKCNSDCEDNLYITRQVHTRLGEKSIRVDRIALNISGQSENTYFSSVKEEHPDLIVLNVKTEDWERWVAKTNLPKNINKKHYYLLMNQESFAMLWYDNTIEGNDLLKDIKHALKYSPDFQK